jgi:hypothetical protein
MAVKITNNATATLASAISSTATSITVSAGQGGLFPTLSGVDFFFATLVDSSNNIEIVRCTARSGDTLTVIRGQDGTAARAYAALDKIEVRVVAAALANKVDVDTPSMTGNMTITRPSPAVLLVKSASGQAAQIQAYTSGNLRWVIDLADSAVEAGSNAGSNFDINRYSDGGAFLDTPFSINRLTGSASFTQPLYVQGQMVFHAGNLPPKLDLSGGTISGNLAVTGTLGITGATSLTSAAVTNTLSVGTSAASSPVVVKAKLADSVAVRVLENASGAGMIQFTDDPVTTDHANITALSTGELRLTGKSRVTFHNGVNELARVDTNGLSVGGAPVAPRPATAAGVGQVVPLNNDSAGSVVLPASGTWFYYVMGFGSTLSLNGGANVGLEAGGATVAPIGGSPTIVRGWAWRIA